MGNCCDKLYQWTGRELRDSHHRNSSTQNLLDMAVYLAALNRDPATIEWMIENGASVNLRDLKQRTALCNSAVMGDATSINILMSHGANPFATDVAGQMPLHFGICEACPALINHMCGLCKCREQHPVDPSQINTADSFGQTCLQHLSDIAPFVELCERYADAPVACVNVVDCEGSSVVNLGSNQKLQGVLQLRLDLLDLDKLQVEEYKDHKLTKIQTHVLRHLLSKHDEYEDDDVPPMIVNIQDFVFGTVIKGNVGAVCSFPCSHAPNPPEIEDILLRKGHPEELCHHVMHSSMGRCDLYSEEAWCVTYDVQKFLTDLSAFFRQQCPPLQFGWKRVGSSMEHCKTGCPDEYDALLHFTKLSEYLEVLDLKIQWTGMDARLRQQMAQYSPHKNSITVGVKVKILQLITDFLAEKKLWGKLSFCCLKQFKCGFSAILSNIDQNLKIKVDLVPLLSHEQKWYVFENVATSGYYGNVDEVSESFALRELDFMRSLPPNAQEGYIMAKTLRNVHLLGHIMRTPILSDLVDRVLPSHALKHALFHAFCGEEHSLKPHEWAQRIFVQMTNEKLTDFFSPDKIFSLSDHPYRRQSHLNLFIQRRRCDLQSFDPKVSENQYRKIFIGEILEILK